MLCRQFLGGWGRRGKLGLGYELEKMALTLIVP